MTRVELQKMLEGGKDNDQLNFMIVENDEELPDGQPIQNKQLPQVRYFHVG